jgi:hypothetical protein
VGRCELDSSGSEKGPVVVSYEHSNAHSGSVKGQKISCRAE